jgi:5'-3' exonuclease
MDTLTFGAPILVRRLTFSEARKLPTLEFRLADILRALELTLEQFIDVCILCGCDYTDTIRGIGPKSALKLIQEHKTIEAALKTLDTSKHPIPESFDYHQVALLQSLSEFLQESELRSTTQARELFLKPEVSDADSLDVRMSCSLAVVAFPLLPSLTSCCCFMSSSSFMMWTKKGERLEKLLCVSFGPQPASFLWFARSLTKFLVEEKGFNGERVARGIEKLKKAKGSSCCVFPAKVTCVPNVCVGLPGSGTQSRMDSFFSAIPSSSPPKPVGVFAIARGLDCALLPLSLGFRVLGR